MTESAGQSFAARLSRLIETVHPPDRGPYSYGEIAAGIQDHPGAMTRAHVQQLASGRRTNPRLECVKALAGFFGVPVNYFFDEGVAREVDAQILGVKDWRDTQAMEIAQRINSLSPDQRNIVSSMLDSLAEYDRQSGGRRRKRKSDQ